MDWLVLIALIIIVPLGIAFILRDHPDWIYTACLCIAFAGVFFGFFGSIVWFYNQPKIDWGSTEVVSMIAFDSAVVALFSAWYIKNELPKNRDK